MRYLVLFVCQVLFFVLLVPIVFAHGGGHKTLYVASNGLDQGKCDTAESPCKTIEFALTHASKGDKIFVAAGEYLVSGETPFFLMSEMIPIRGGYTAKDGFKIADPQNNTTTIIGMPFEYRSKLTEKGFRLLQDPKAESIQASIAQKELLGLFSQLTENVESNITCENGMANNYPCNKVDLLSHIPLSQFSSNPDGTNDIWGFVDLNDNREYAIIGLTNGTAVVDVTDPLNAKEVGTITGKYSTWRDIKVYQYQDEDGEWMSYAYVTTEARQGLQVIDLTELPAKISLAHTFDEFKAAHNVYIGNVDYANGTVLEGMEPYLYIAGSDLSGGAFHVLDLKNPAKPTTVTPAPNGSEYVHDATSFVLTDERVESCAANHNPCEIFVDFNENTVDIWDVTDKDAPVQISSTGYDGSAYVHSGWWSKDKKFVFVHDELDERNSGANTTLRTLDISDLENPFISNIWVGPTQAIDHNGFTVGDKYYMSNYRRGLTVLDVSNPNAPTEIGFFDTFAVPADNSSNFNGAWGTYPFLPSGNIIVSDIEYGLFVLKDNSVVSEQATN